MSRQSASKRRRSRAVAQALEPRQLLTGTWAALATPVPNISPGNPDGAQIMMLLSDGTVMVHGIVGNASKAWYRLTSIGNGDYVHGNWSAMASMNAGRLYFGSNVLPSGKVLVVGGEYAPGDPNGQGSNQSSAEIYDPFTDSWSYTTDFNTTGHSQFGDDPTAMLPDGEVLAGYINGTNTYRFNPASASPTWTKTAGDKLDSDQSDEESWVTLPDNSILSYDVYGSSTVQGLAQRYFPGLDMWEPAGTMPFVMSAYAVGYEMGPGFLLPDGRVWYAGGNGKTAFYTPSTNTWTAGTSIPNGYVAADAPGAMLPNGHILIAASPLGGQKPNGAYIFPNGTKVYEFDPNGNGGPGGYTEVTPNIAGFDLSTATGVNSYQTSMLVLPNGHVLMSNTSGKIIEYTPDGAPNNAWRPNVTNITSVGFNIFHVTGTQLTGISEGAAYGDDNEMSSNYPIVQLQNNAGQYAYGRTFNWSIGVAKGSAVQSFDFTLPAGWSPDAYLMTVNAAGIGSGVVLSVQMGTATTSNLTLQPNTTIPTGFIDVIANGSFESTWAISSFNTIVVSGDSSNDLIVMNDPYLGGRFVTLNGNSGNDIIRVEASGVQTLVNGDDGDDFTDFSFYAHNLSNITGTTTVNGGSGDDSIFVYDNAVSGNGGYSVNSNGIARSGWGGLAYGTGVEHASLTTGTGNNPVSVTSTNANQNIFLYSAGGADAVTVGGTGTTQSILGSIEIHNSPNFTSLTVDDTNDFGSRDIVIDNSGSFGVLTGITGPIGGAISWANSDLSSLTVNISQFGSGTVAVRAMSKPLTLHNVTVGNQGADYAISLGNSTNGMQSIIANVTLIPAFGQNQSLTLDDSGDTVGRTAALTRSSLNGDYSLSGLAPVIITFRDFGSLVVQQGSGADTFTAGGASQGGYDNDLPMTVSGNGGNDNYILTTFNNWGEGLGGTFTFPVMFDGGTGFNSLSINDSARGNASYQLYADRFYARDSTAFAVGSDFNYDNMGAIGVTCSNGNNPFAVYSTSSDIAAGNQITVVLNGGNDTATMYPHDAQGNLTINGTIGIVGGTGTDTMIFDDTGASNGIDYSFSNPFGAGTQDVFGIGAAGMGYTSDFESATIKGGDGTDTFDVNQYKSNVPLAIYGGGGDDTLNLGGNNLPSNIIMASGAFLFDGQGGFDRFNLNNSNEISQWTYTGGMNVEANRGSPVFGYDVLFQGTHNEETTVNAGPGADTFVPAGIGAGTHVVFNGAGGMDSFVLSQNSTIFSLLKSKITFDAGDAAIYGSFGGGSVSVAATITSTPIVVHLTDTTLGAFPEDNLLGPGGSVEFLHANSLSLTLGSGADTVYAAPNATATVSIIGGNPTTAPGDTINLALAEAVGYSVNPTSSTAGNVTSSNLKTLTYSGFESGPNVDDTAPLVVNADFQIAPAAAAPLDGPPLDPGAQSISVTFSEDIAAFLNAGFLSLYNATTASYISSDDIAVDYDAANFIATFTFPNFPGEQLPDGTYTAQINGGLADSFGNSSVASDPYTFIWSGGTSADDTFRVALDPSASIYQVFLNDDSTPAFVAGSELSKIVLFGGDGNDTFTFDLNGGGTPNAPGGMIFDGQDGSDNLGVLGSPAADSTIFGATNILANGSQIDHSNIESFTYDGGGGSDDTLEVAAGKVGLGSTQHFDSLTVDDAATVEMPGAGDSVLVVRNLTIAPTGRIDLAGGAMIYDYAGDSPLSMVRDLLALGRDGGAWDGDGITSTNAAIDPTTAVGFAEVTDLSSPLPDVFAGETIDDTAILLRFTKLADANLNGGVNALDFNALATSFGAPNASWANGDFNYDGAVDTMDFTALAMRFNESLPASASASPNRLRAGSQVGSLFSERVSPAKSRVADLFSAEFVGDPLTF